METVRSFLEYYDSVSERTNHLLKVVPTEQINFSYKKGKFTIGDQIRHIAAIERFMFCETIEGRKNRYFGCGKELADKYDSVLIFFNRMHNEALDIISKLRDEDLKRYCVTPTGRKINIGKWLQLLAEHEIHHRAELYIYLNILCIDTPPMYGITSEELINQTK